MHEEATASETDRVIHRNQVTIGSVDANADAVAATGKPVTYNEIFIFRFADGRVVETWGVVDVYAQMKQIGVIPT